MSDSQPNLQGLNNWPTGSPSKAYLDTTVVANALLRGDGTGKRCADAIRRFSYSETPEYALKEFKAGPVRGWIWCHNKFNETRSFADTIAAINVMSSTPQRNFSASARQAFEQAANADRDSFATALDLRGRDERPIDRALADRYRLYLRRKLVTAWQRRRALADNTSMPLSCFVEGDLREPNDGSLSFERYSCPKEAKCDVFVVLRKRLDEVARVANALKSQPQKSENDKRYQSLRHILRTPNRAFSDNLCRSLGDAVFAIMAPSDCVILTTNIKDHAPLAKAVGKVAVEP